MENQQYPAPQWGTDLTGLRGTPYESAVKGWTPVGNQQGVDAVSTKAVSSYKPTAQPAQSNYQSNASTTYRDPLTGKIYDFQGAHITSLPEYQKGVMSGQYSSALDISKAPWKISSPADISQGSSTAREEKAGTQSAAANLYNNLKLNEGVSADTTNILQNEVNNISTDYTKMKEAMDEAERIRKSMGLFTPEEQMQIEQAGTAAGLQYDELLAEAERQKSYGMPKATIGAGERGGFMSTQFAGVAALAPTVGGDFAGTGGELNKIKSEYDYNISQLKVKRLQAIATAKDAARTAMQTGKAADLKAAQDAFAMAKTLSEQSSALAKAKADAISSYESVRSAQFGYGTNVAANLAPALINVDSTDGSISVAEDSEITRIASENKIDPNILRSYINNKVNELQQQDITNRINTYNAMQKGGSQTASIQEYEYYAQQAKASGQPVKSFEQWQTDDANRKVLASTIANNSGMTTAQTSNFMSITTKYQQDALVQAYDKGAGLGAIADQVIANPKSATNQLKSLYILVKNLDPDSAVREGELALANNTTSYLQQFKTSLDRINAGQVIAPKAAEDLARATKELVSAWEAAKNARLQRYLAQANTVGIGDAFGKYISSSEPLSSNVDTVSDGEWGW